MRKTTKSLVKRSVQIAFTTAMMIKKPDKRNCGKEDLLCVLLQWDTIPHDKDYEAAGHIASAKRKQRQTDTFALLPVFYSV